MTNMGTQNDVMVLFAERDIRQLFSEYDGWKVAPVRISQPAGRFYKASRGIWGGGEVAFLAVSFDMKPKEALISALDTLPDGHGSRTKKYLLAPRAADTTEVPHNIRILSMKAFACDKEKLVWLTKKKNAKKVIEKQPVAA